MNNKKTFFCKRNIIYLSLILFLIILLVINFIILAKKPVYQQTVDAKVVFSDKIGMVINYTTLDFGELPLPARANKTIILSNTFNDSLYVIVYVEGNISDYLYGLEKFEIASGEIYNYDVILGATENVEKGEYFGSINFVFYDKNRR